MKTLARFVLGCTSVICGASIFAARPATVRPNERELIAILERPGDVVSQCEACRELLVVGTKASVPALAAALTRERVGHAALNTLEQQIFPEATAAIRDALGRPSGPFKLSLIDALGTRRDAQAVALLAPMLAGADIEVAAAAATALGKVGDAAALAALEAALGDPATRAPAAVQAGALTCAGARLAAGASGDAVRIFGQLSDATANAPIRAAAWRGLVLADAARRSERLLGAITGADEELRAVALKLVRELRDRPTLEALLARWDALPAPPQLAALDVHLAFGAEAAATVRRALESPAAIVRLAAIEATATTRDVSFVPVLVRTAARAGTVERDAARTALTRIDDPAAGSALLAHLEGAPADEKAEVLRALGERAGEATGMLLRFARDGDEMVATAAYRALLRRADPATLSPLLDLARTPRNESEQRMLLRVLTAICELTPGRARASRQVLDALGQFAREERARWWPLLPALGTAEAMDEVLQATRGNDQEAVRLLSTWKSALAVGPLIDLAGRTGDSELAALARSGAFATAGREPNASTRLAACEEIAPLVREPGDKAKLLALLRKTELPGSARLASTFLRDPAVGENAAAAVVEISEALLGATRQMAAVLSPEDIRALRSPDLVERALALQRRSDPAAARQAIAERWSGPDRFRQQRLVDRFYAEGAAVADFNRDGHPDIVAGPFWFEGPKFTVRHEFRTAGPFPPVEYSDVFLIFTGDFNADGWPDLLNIPYPGKECAWFANPQGRAEKWTPHPVHPSVGNESPLVGDVDGDGRMDLVFCAPGTLGYASPDPAHPDQPWTFHPIGSDRRFQRFTHGLGLGDIDGDGRADVVEATGWWEQPVVRQGGKPWAFHPHKFAEQAAQMLTCDVDRDGRLDVITSWHCHGYGLLWWKQIRRADGAIDWVRNDILPAEPKLDGAELRVSQMHALALADINGDGRPDIVTGKRFWAHGPNGDKEPSAPAVLLWFELQQSPEGAIRFVPHLIDSNSGVGTQVTVADLDGDNRPDVVVSNKKGIFVHWRQ